jgi:hypothetical protein
MRTTAATPRMGVAQFPGWMCPCGCSRRIYAGDRVAFEDGEWIRAACTEAERQVAIEWAEHKVTARKAVPAPAPSSVIPEQRRPSPPPRRSSRPPRLRLRFW